MNITQLKQPFEIYDANVGKFFPKTPPARMLELLRNCGEHRVSNKEVRELFKINRPSATKLLNKLCDSGVVHHPESPDDGSKVELTDQGRKMLADLEAAIAASPATTQVPEQSSPEVRRPTEPKAKQQVNSLPPIRLDELESRIGTLISKVRAKAASQPQEAKCELPPKRPPMRVPKGLRNIYAEGQLPLDFLLEAPASGS
jgi:DNA-binding MarR family transcriptional regulator